MDKSNQNKLRDSSREATLIELIGEDESIWKWRASTFFHRLFSKFNAILDMQVPGRSKVKDEIKTGVGGVLDNIYAMLDRNKIGNAEKKARIAHKLSEIRKQEAEIRNINADTALKELEVEERLAMMKARETQAAQMVLGQLMEEGTLQVGEVGGMRVIMVTGTLSRGRLEVASSEGRQDKGLRESNTSGQKK
ncbi:MAG: hypothetical protein WED00_16510 [Aquisalimonadaceae bacterium]